MFLYRTGHDLGLPSHTWDAHGEVHSGGLHRTIRVGGEDSAVTLVGQGGKRLDPVMEHVFVVPKNGNIYGKVIVYWWYIMDHVYIYNYHIIFMILIWYATIFPSYMENNYINIVYDGNIWYIMGISWVYNGYLYVMQWMGLSQEHGNGKCPMYRLWSYLNWPFPFLITGG